MTSKRKNILKAMAFASCTTIDDLVMTTGLERKNLHDNVKATLKDELCQRIKDDATRPASSQEGVVRVEKLYRPALK